MERSGTGMRITCVMAQGLSCQQLMHDGPVGVVVFQLQRGAAL